MKEFLKMQKAVTTKKKINKFNDMKIMILISPSSEDTIKKWKVIEQKVFPTHVAGEQTFI
jgi:hypothetical protein